MPTRAAWDAGREALDQRTNLWDYRFKFDRRNFLFDGDMPSCEVDHVCVLPHVLFLDGDELVSDAAPIPLTR